MQLEQIEDLYAQLSQMLKRYRTEPFSLQHIKSGFSFAELMLNQLRDNADPVAGQLLLYKRQLPYVQNLTFNTCLLTALLCMRNRINETCAQQLICAAVTVYAFQQAEIEKYARALAGTPTIRIKKDLLAMLGKTHLDVWQSGYATAASLGFDSLRLKGPQRQLQKLQKILISAHLLSIQITPRQNSKTLNFAKALKKLAQQNQSLTNTLAPLAQYPGMMPPGSLIRWHSGDIAVVLSACADKLVVRDKQQIGSVRTLDSDTVIQVGACQPVRQMGATQQYWDDEWQAFVEMTSEVYQPHDQSFKLDRPPPVILRIQQQLENDDVDIDNLADLIASEPLLVNHLRETATSSTRQNIQVQEVKHGLMVHGYERTTSLLLQQALILRLNQHYFPLQEQFIQFTRLRMFFASAVLEKNALMSERAATLACFATSGLFTSQHFKGLRRWTVSSQVLFDIDTLSDNAEKTHLHKNSLVLAAAWKLPGEDLKALGQQSADPQTIKGNNKVRALSAALGLSLVMARKLLFSQPDPCSETERYLKSAMQFFELDAEHIKVLYSRAAERCHLSCPLDA